MKILVTGHWYRPASGDVYSVLERERQTLDAPGCADQQRADVSLDVGPSSVRALEALGRGIVQSVPDAEVDCVLFGAGADFVGSLAGGGMRDVWPVSIPVSCVDAYEVGAAVSAAVAAGERVVVESGHTQVASLWESFVEGALGMTRGELSADGGLAEAGVAALVRLRDVWASCPVVMVTSSLRPFVGLSSAVAVAPNLELRREVGAEYVPVVRRVFDLAYQRNCPALGVSGPVVSPVTVAGSGAGGGVGAVIVAIGGRIVEAGEYLSAALDLEQVVSGYDLVVVLEPELHSPVLAQAQLDAITAAAAHHALPVVAVGVDSSLSRPECAQWGVHGVMLCADNEQALLNVGMRIGHTWARRLV